MHSIESGSLKGVFSTSELGSVGFGATKRKVTQEVLYYVEEQSDGRVSLQPLNESHIPSGEVRFIPREMLLKDFLPEPTIYTQKMLPALEEVEGAIERGDAGRSRGELFSAEHEYKSALRMDESNIRATFGLGLTYLEREEKDKAVLVFRRLVKLRDTFKTKHKHLFNEFGINLRKTGMLTEALKYYARAHKLGRDDEHLLYNMARTLFDKGNMSAAYGFLQKAMALNPGFKPAKGFLAYMERQGLMEMAAQAGRQSGNSGGGGASATSGGKGTGRKGTGRKGAGRKGTGRKGAGKDAAMKGAGRKGTGKDAAMKGDGLRNSSFDESIFDESGLDESGFEDFGFSDLDSAKSNSGNSNPTVSGSDRSAPKNTGLDGFNGKEVDFKSSGSKDSEPRDSEPRDSEPKDSEPKDSEPMDSGGLDDFDLEY